MRHYHKPINYQGPPRALLPEVLGQMGGARQALYCMMQIWCEGDRYATSMREVVRVTRPMTAAS
jgi:hypothetical protein